MTNKTTLKLALGTSLVAGIALGSVQAAESNPFSSTKLDSGYLQLAENKSGEMEIRRGYVNGGNMKKDKDAEGKCGGKSEECPADADKDGKVTKEEFLAHHGKMFEEADANKDGALDADERKALHKKMAEGKCGGKAEERQKLKPKPPPLKLKRLRLKANKPFLSLHKRSLRAAFVALAKRE